MPAATFPVLSAGLASAVLVTACGTQPAQSPAASANAAVSTTPVPPGDFHPVLLHVVGSV